MKFTIIEDCSPYYIRFTHDGLGEFVSYALNVYDQVDWSLPTIIDNSAWTNLESYHSGFLHRRLDESLGIELLSQTPVSSKIPLMTKRVSFFTTAPGFEYRAHKDGANHRFSINYPIRISDDKCITNWYGEDLTNIYPLDHTMYDSSGSMECVGFDKTQHVPVKTMTAKPNEAILFNADIWHTWDNSQSDNERIVLTLRGVGQGNVSFEEAKILLGLD